LRGGITYGIVQRQILGHIGAYIMEGGIEICKVQSHMKTRFEHTNFR